MIKTLLQDYEEALGDVPVIADGMPADSEGTSSKMHARNLYSVYKAKEIVQSVIVMGANDLYQMRSPLFGGGSSETGDCLQTLLAAFHSWASTNDRPTAPVLLADAAFQKKVTFMKSLGIDLKTTWSAAKTEDRPNEPGEASLVRTRQSLRAKIEVISDLVVS